VRVYSEMPVPSYYSTLGMLLVFPASFQLVVGSHLVNVGLCRFKTSTLLLSACKLQPNELCLNTVAQGFNLCSFLSLALVTGL